MSIQDQMDALVEDQAKLLTYLQENYATLEAEYRKTIILAIDQLEDQWIALVRQEHKERRKAWATE